MQNDNRAEYNQRNKILKMLSDEEVARVSRAETEATLAKGDEFVDLEHLDRGVQRAGDSPLRRNNVLPKKAVGEATWLEIVSSLPFSHS